jgi:hypothetical protein
VLLGELTGKAEVGGQTAASRKIIQIIAEVINEYGFSRCNK